MSMDEYLFAGENLIKTKGSNFLLRYKERCFRRFGEDMGTKLLGLHEKESIGGWLYLTNFRLFFQSHLVNRFNGTLSIFLPNIIETKNNPGLITKIMEVVTLDYSFEFIAWGVPTFMTAVAAARNSLSPQQTEQLRIAVRDSPEKCGDGLKVFPSDLFVRF